MFCHLLCRACFSIGTFFHRCRVYFFVTLPSPFVCSSFTFLLFSCHSFAKASELCNVVHSSIRWYIFFSPLPHILFGNKVLRFSCVNARARLKCLVENRDGKPAFLFLLGLLNFSLIKNILPSSYINKNTEKNIHSLYVLLSHNRKSQSFCLTRFSLSWLDFSFLLCIRYRLLSLLLDIIVVGIVIYLSRHYSGSFSNYWIW